MSVAAEVYEPATGIVMKVETDQPGLQFYSGNFMDGTEIGKRGDRHNFRTGIALETQNFPPMRRITRIFRPPCCARARLIRRPALYAFSVRK